ncbi:MAG: hypothetical protein GY811_27855 [Myxococcales bacterium]|nr:hypothetical protein [Myxococcales bacterium]
MSLWLSKNLLAAIANGIASCGEGDVAIADAPRIHKALRRARPNLVRWSTGRKELDAMVVGGFAQGANWEARAEAWRESLVPGGLLLSVDRGAASEVSRRLLCAGFTDLVQVRIARRLVTYGRMGAAGNDSGNAVKAS